MPEAPSLFVSHGAPTLLLDDLPARQFLSGLGAEIGRPRAILVASAHWETGAAEVSGAASPETIHDFYGFPHALYQIRYAAPGDPELADAVADAIRAAGHECAVDPRRGLDHGAWVPLALMFSRADVPVLQISLSPSLGARYHVELGRALSGLRERGVLVLGSGSATHNLAAFRGQAADAPAPDWVTDFNEWLASRVEAGDMDALVEYRTAHPQAARNHPSEEHYFPLLVAAAAGDAPGRRLHHSYSYGVLSMDAYSFG